MPSAITPPASPPGESTAPSFAMQKYLLLHSQHEELRKHIDFIRSTPSFSPASSASYASSPSSSPTHSACSPVLQFPVASSSRSHSRRSSLPSAPKTRHVSPPLAPLVDESLLYEAADEERRLFDINEAMKRSLTELLNEDLAKQDPSFRTWVQCRLMDTEKELRSERRRRSAA